MDVDSENPWPQFVLKSHPSISYKRKLSCSHSKRICETGREIEYRGQSLCFFHHLATTFSRVEDRTAADTLQCRVAAFHTIFRMNKNVKDLGKFRLKPYAYIPGLLFQLRIPLVRREEGHLPQFDMRLTDFDCINRTPSIPLHRIIL